MRTMVGLVLNSWIYGVPIVLLAWAALRLLHRAHARVLYVLVIVAFVAVMVMPLLPREVRVAVAEGSGMETVADAITFPFTMLWAIGAAILLTREVVGHWRLRGPREDAPNDLRQMLEWPERVPLAVADAMPPLTIGSRVILPRDIAATFPLEIARRIARHELSHWRWRDPFVYALMRVAASVLWLWPLWPLLRWARREREVAADEFALRAAGDEEHYVAALLRLAHVQRSPASAMAASDLEFRARRILGVGRRSSGVMSFAVFGGAMALMAIAEPVRVEPFEPMVIAPVTRAVLVAPAPAPAPAPVVEVSVQRHVVVHRHVVDSQESE